MNTIFSTTLFLIFSMFSFASDSNQSQIENSSFEIGHKVWLDNNHNGIQERGESGVSGIEVMLYNRHREAIGTTRTNTNGDYFFEGLKSQGYRIGFTIPEGYTVTKQHQGSDRSIDSDVSSRGVTAPIYLKANSDYNAIDMGIYQTPSALGNKVWYDSNANGLQEHYEEGVAGIKVKLYDQYDTVINSSLTNANGYYQFQNLAPNSYFIGFEVPKTYKISSHKIYKSEINHNLIKTEAIKLLSAQERHSVDLGLFQEYSNFSNKEWLDKHYRKVPKDKWFKRDRLKNKHIKRVVANDDKQTASLNQNITLNVLINDINSSIPNLGEVKLIDPNNKRKVEVLEVKGEGRWQVNGNKTVSFHPSRSIREPKPIDYVVQEEGGFSNSAKVTVAYPDIVDDELTVKGKHGELYQIDVLENDSSDIRIDTLLLGCDTGVKRLKIAKEGTWSVEKSGLVTFKREDGFMDTPTTIQYSVELSSGKRSNCANIDIKHKLLKTPILSDQEENLTRNHSFEPTKESIPTLTVHGLVVLFLLMGLLGRFLLREEV